jgi:hypothetical protein
MESSSSPSALSSVPEAAPTSASLVLPLSSEPHSVSTPDANRNNNNTAVPTSVNSSNSNDDRQGINDSNINKSNDSNNNNSSSSISRKNLIRNYTADTFTTNATTSNPEPEESETHLDHIHTQQHQQQQLQAIPPRLTSTASKRTPLQSRSTTPTGLKPTIYGIPLEKQQSTNIEDLKADSEHLKQRHHSSHSEHHPKARNINGWEVSDQ